MKIIDRYILISFIKLYLIISAAFVSVFVVVEFFENFSRFLGQDAKIIYLSAFFLLRIPYIFILSSPFSILLASLFLMYYMNRHNEIVAMQSSGISVVRMFIPLFLFGFFISIIIILFGDWTLSSAEEKRDYIKDVKIYKRPKQDFRMRSNIQYKDELGRLYYIGFLDGYRNKIKNIDISEFNDNNEIIEKIIAKYALWEAISNSEKKEKQITFYDGYIRKFDEGKLISNQKFNKIKIPSINLQPEDLVKSSKKPEEMSFFELQDYIERLRKIGEKHQRELVELNIKFSFPLVNLIILLFCIPISTLTIKGKSRGISFVVGIALCFLYISAVRMGQSLGYNGILSPFLAAWFANIIFVSLGLFLLIRSSK